MKFLVGYRLDQKVIARHWSMVTVAQELIDEDYHIARPYSHLISQFGQKKIDPEVNFFKTQLS